MLTKRFFLFATLLGLCINSSVGQNTSESIAILDANNVKAYLSIGELWTNFNGGEGYVFPQQLSPDLEVSTIFSGGLWFSGLDSAGDIKVAASTYGSNTYRPGPLDEQTGLLLDDSVLNWDKHFETTNADITAFLDDWSDGILDNSIPLSLLKWPAKGNPHFYPAYGFLLPNSSQGLAPFIDSNNDGIYNPIDGDYPSIKGATQAIWWVMNSIGSFSLRFEIQMMAYAYASSNTAVNNTTYYDVRYINRAEETLDSMFVSLWLDPDLGCHLDDYQGCISEEDMAFFYNEDAVDGSPGCQCDGGVSTYCEEIPVIGVKLVEGPLTDRLKDGNGGGTIPPLGIAGDTIMEVGLSSYIIYNNGSVGTPTPYTTNPSSLQEYYNYMNGRFKDNSPLLNSDGELTNYMYDGNPANLEDWTMCSEGLDFGDRRMLMNIGPLRLHPGQTGDFTYCVTGVENVVHPCPDISVLSEALEEASAFLENVSIPTSVERLSSTNQLSIYPNPMTSQVNIDLKKSNDSIDNISLYRVDGQLVRELNQINKTKQIIKRGNLNSGIYFYQLTTTSGQQYTGKLVIE